MGAPVVGTPRAAGWLSAQGRLNSRSLDSAIEFLREFNHCARDDISVVGLAGPPLRLRSGQALSTALGISAKSGQALESAYHKTQGPSTPLTTKLKVPRLRDRIPEGIQSLRSG